MSVTKQLINSFETIKVCPLVSGDITKEHVNNFVDLLNRAIPSPLNPMAYTLYRFNRTKYIADKQKFVADIKGFQPYESMILWLDFKDILEYFKLDGKIFLGWDKKNNRYRGFVLPSDPVEPNQVKILRRGETLQSASLDNETLPTTIDEKHFDAIPECEGEKMLNEIDDDMDKIYLHMQNRLLAVTKAINRI